MSESTFSYGKALFFVLVLVAAGYGAYWWFFEQPVSAEHPIGFTVWFPNGWELKSSEAQVSGEGTVPSAGFGSGAASWHPSSGRGAAVWPEAGLYLFPGRPDSYETTEIDGCRAVIGVYNFGPDRRLCAAIDRGDGLIVYQIGCKSSGFDTNRSRFEKLARKTKCRKP